MKDQNLERFAADKNLFLLILLFKHNNDFEQPIT